MIKIKKIISFIIKFTLIVVVLATLLLFLYTVFFYEKPKIEDETTKNKISTEKKLEEVKEQEIVEEKKVDPIKIKEFEKNIKDSLFVTVGNQAITKFDIVNEVKAILISNNMVYSPDKKNILQKMAVKSVIKSSVKKIAIDQNNFLNYSQEDLKIELTKIANKLGVNLDTFKKICLKNNLDFSIIENKIKADLLWNSLIFNIYRDRVSVNLQEIDEQLKLRKDKKESYKYLLSEIVFKTINKNELQSKLNEIKNRIEVEGFESVAMKSSIAQSAVNGGNLGWVNENQVATEFRKVISETSIGDISTPLLLNEGILIFKVKDRKKIVQKINLEELKKQLIDAEKTKILNMYSMSHYDNLKRFTVINFLNE